MSKGKEVIHRKCLKLRTINLSLVALVFFTCAQLTSSSFALFTNDTNINSEMQAAEIFPDYAAELTKLSQNEVSNTYEKKTQLENVFVVKEGKSESYAIVQEKIKSAEYILFEIHNSQKIVEDNLEQLHGYFKKIDGEYTKAEKTNSEVYKYVKDALDKHMTFTEEISTVEIQCTQAIKDTKEKLTTLKKTESIVDKTKEKDPDLHNDVEEKVAPVKAESTTKKEEPKEKVANEINSQNNSEAEKPIENENENHNNPEVDTSDEKNKNKTSSEDSKDAGEQEKSTDKELQDSSKEMVEDGEEENENQEIDQ
ncbi:hypothetical protein [Guptibacillus hwajinpoensis]|uniref:hypothetical protein n=1 Tax=Guptibacillus hwajinpoensis TaxID=208199 RepID=UPI001CFD06AE|nr:hypothetical protein [Pseudalkalibacillus hwajinpoensis]WLR61536.1 hypothetical protein LC071_09735 [Pseudalkalibacillus hwajinpoensis]